MPLVVPWCLLSGDHVSDTLSSLWFAMRVRCTYDVCQLLETILAEQKCAHVLSLSVWRAR